MASLIAQQAALQQPLVAANMPQRAASSQPGYQADALATGQLPPGMGWPPVYTQSDLSHLFASSQNPIAWPPTQVIHMYSAGSDKASISKIMLFLVI